MSEPEKYRPSRGFVTTLVLVIVAALALSSNAAAHHGQSSNTNPPGYWACPSHVICNATSFDDHVIGTPGPDNMRGLNGNDYISGNDLNDLIYGGHNRPYGSAGTISVEEIRGQGGNDTLYAGCPGGCTQINTPDHIFGGDGKDQIRAINGKHDYIEGGAGLDNCYVDPSWDAWSGCEIVHFS